MPRNLSGVYSLPSGSLVTDATDDILASQHNTPLEDIQTDMNTVRPVVAGGTEANNAADARTNLGAAASATTLTAGAGLTGGGTLAANRTFAVGAGDGISVAADAVAVDSTVVRTTGAQTIAGAKSFTGNFTIGTGVELLVGNVDTGSNFRLGLSGMTTGSTTPNFIMQCYAATTDVTGVLRMYRGTTLEFRMAANGDVDNTNNSYGAISDARLKKDIEPASAQLDALRQIEVVKYRLKDADADSPKHVGVIAQQLQGIKPGLVREHEDGTLSVKYSVLSVLALKALQELADRVDALEARISASEGTRLL